MSMPELIWLPDEPTSYRRCRLLTARGGRPLGTSHTPCDEAGAPRQYSRVNLDTHEACTVDDVLVGRQITDAILATVYGVKVEDR